jgi:hypothetical protein
MNRKRLAIVFALLGGIAGGAFAQTIVTIDNAVDLAIRNNLSLQRTKMTADAKKRTSGRSWNSLIPEVNAATALSRSNADTYSGSTDITPSETISASLTLSPSIVSSMKKARLDYEAGLIDYVSAKRALNFPLGRHSITSFYTKLKSTSRREKSQRRGPNTNKRPPWHVSDNHLSWMP